MKDGIVHLVAITGVLMAESLTLTLTLILIQTLTLMLTLTLTLILILILVLTITLTLTVGLLFFVRELTLILVEGGRRKLTLDTNFVCRRSEGANPRFIKFDPREVWGS